MSGVKKLINNSSNARINGENKQDGGLDEDEELILLLEQSQKVLDKNVQKNLVNTKTTNKPNLVATDRFKTPNTLVPTISKTSKNDANVEGEDDNNDDLNAFLNVLENSQQSTTHKNASILHNKSVNNHASINVSQKTQKESNEVFFKEFFFNYIFYYSLLFILVYTINIQFIEHSSKKSR